MRKVENETYEQWLARVQEHELQCALANLASGQDFDQVLEELANKITAKALHPILKELKKTSLDK